MAEIEDVDPAQLMGSHFSVLCSGYGNPPPDVYWSRMSGELRSGWYEEWMRS